MPWRGEGGGFVDGHVEGNQRFANGVLGVAICLFKSPRQYTIMF